MNDQELEKTLLETLRIAKESQKLIIDVDRRQRWARNWRAFYWAFIVVLALTGYYFAFPYLETIREGFKSFSTQAEGLINISQQIVK